MKAAEDNHAMLPELAVSDIDDEHRNAIPLIKNEVSAKYGMWTFDPPRQADLEWVAKAQNYPLDKIDPEIAVDRSFIPKS